MQNLFHLTNTTNYSGIFETGRDYEKFDIVYNSGDSRFYYATEDMSYGGGALVEGTGRFYLDPDGPQGINGAPTHYIFDDINENYSLNNQIKVGQTIHLTGTLHGSDGYYKVLAFDNDIETPTEDEADPNVLSALDATKVEGVPNLYVSEWFFHVNKDTAEEYESRYLFVFPSDWVYSPTFGWSFFSVGAEAGRENLWFWLPRPGGSKNDTRLSGYWFWTDTAILGSSNPSRDSFVYLSDENTGSEFGPNGNWLHFQKSHLEQYELIFFNYGNNRWYGMESANQNVDILNYSASPPAVINEDVQDRLKDGISARIQIQGVDEQTKIKAIEEPSTNFISIQGIEEDLSSSYSRWVKDKFFFDADYGSSVSFDCDIYKYQFGNGYYINQPRNVNCLKFEANLIFKNRTNKEANALTHFVENHQGQHETHAPSATLDYKQGFSGFYWDGNASFHPYDSLSNQTKNFYCQEFSRSLNFENSNDLNVKLVNYDTSILNKSEELYTKRPDDYSGGMYFSRDDITFYTGNNQYYYFHKGDKTESFEAPVPAVMHEEWSRESGWFEDVNKDYWTRDFFWKPSLGLTVNQKPRVNNISVAGSYSQLYKDGINEDLLSLNLNFNNRDDAESYAILHFLEQHYGCIPFKFSPPAPYESEKNFICTKWNHSYNYKNNHSINVTFEEFPLGLDAEDFLNNIGPSPETPAELILSSPITVASEEDEVRINDVFSKRVFIKNIGGKPAEITSVNIDSDFFKILSLPDYGQKRFYMDSIDKGAQLTSSIASQVYTLIFGFTDSGHLAYFNSKISSWKVEDLVDALLNSSEFLSTSNNSDARINAVFRELLARDADLDGLAYYKGSDFTNMHQVVAHIMTSDEFKNLEKASVKFLSKNQLKDQVVTIPNYQLTAVQLNGKKIKILESGEEGCKFEDVSNNDVYFQYLNGDILKPDGSVLSNNYFVHKKIFNKIGFSIIEGGDDAYIDIIFDAPEDASLSKYLVDKNNQIIEWCDSSGNSGGNIKLESLNAWMYAGLSINSNANNVEAQIKSWVIGEVMDEVVEQTTPWLDIESLLFPKVQINLHFLTYFHLDLDGIDGDGNLTIGKYPVVVAGKGELFEDLYSDIEMLDSENRVVDFNIFANVPNKYREVYQGMWVPYTFSAFIPEDGGMILFPYEMDGKTGSSSIRYFDQTYAWTIAKLNNLIEGNFIEINMTSLNFLSSLNTSSHTIISVETSTEDLPSGYSSKIVQKGICKFDEYAEAFGKVAIQSLSMGNVLVEIDSFASNYGIIYNGTNYDVIDSEGNYAEREITLSKAYEVWNDFNVNRKQYKKFIDNLYGPSCSRHAAYVVSYKTYNDNGDHYIDNSTNLSSYGIDAMYRDVPSTNTYYESQLEKNISQIQRGLYEPLPQTDHTFLKIRPHYYVSENIINSEQKREIDLAIETVEGIVRDRFLFDLDIVESPVGRFGLPQASLAYLVTSYEQDILLGGLNYLRGDAENYPKRLRATLGINPEEFLKYSTNLDIDSNYDNRSLSPVYWIVLHELLHALGHGSYFDEPYVNSLDGVTDSSRFDVYSELIETDEYGLQYVGSEGVSKYKEMVNQHGLSSSDFYFDKIPIDNSRHIAEYSRKHPSSSMIQVTFPQELMSPMYPVIEKIPAPLSRMSIGILKDLGYDVSYSEAVELTDPYLVPETKIRF